MFSYCVVFIWYAFGENACGSAVLVVGAESHKSFVNASKDFPFLAHWTSQPFC